MRTHVINVLLLAGTALAASGQHHKVAGLEKLPPGEDVLWTDPGDVASLDLIYGSGGRDGEPRPPFSFLKEDLGGTTAKVSVKDAQGRVWSVKFGAEARPEVFCNRLVWACGYGVEIEYFVSHGQISGAHGLKRVKSEIGLDGSFANARFQLRADSPKFLKDSSWSWVENPFTGTPQFNGLRIMMMLLSNWDAKDSRDLDPGGAKSGSADTNLGVLQETAKEGTRYLYFVDDWGASMGRWGGAASRSKWDCAGYAEQTPEFVSGVHEGTVEWGFGGKHEGDIKEKIRVEDVRWLLQYLGRLTDDQITGALASSGATPGQLECYARAVRNRIDQLKRIAGGE